MLDPLRRLLPDRVVAAAWLYRAGGRVSGNDVFWHVATGGRFLHDRHGARCAEGVHACQRRLVDLSWFRQSVMWHGGPAGQSCGARHSIVARVPGNGPVPLRAVHSRTASAPSAKPVAVVSARPGAAAHAAVRACAPQATLPGIMHVHHSLTLARNAVTAMSRPGSRQTGHIVVETMWRRTPVAFHGMRSGRRLDSVDRDGCRVSWSRSLSTRFMMRGQ